MVETQSEEQVQGPEPSSSLRQKPSIVSRRRYIALISAALLVSFFLPWTHILGANVTGLDIQKNFDSYKLVWLLPATAGLSLIMTIIGRGEEIMRQVAGVVPFIIAIYSYSKFGNDLWRIIAPGGWLALATGACLVFLPRKSKTKE